MKNPNLDKYFYPKTSFQGRTECTNCKILKDHDDTKANSVSH